MINLERNITLSIPEDHKEAVTLLQYEPGLYLHVQVRPGRHVGGKFSPYDAAPSGNYRIDSTELAAMLAKPEIASAINTILSECWDIIDAKRIQVEG